MTSVFQTTVQYVSTFLAIFFGALLAWNQYRQGGSQVASEVITAYKERVGQFESQVKDYTKQVNELSVKIGHLEGVISEKEKQIQRYETIFANRNPELEAILKQVVDFMKQIQEHMEWSKKELTKQTAALDIPNDE